ncbi:MAG: helix-turn-helix transcriptional regulator [Oscillospiraceae bacterium]|nr:helix-turn-helix transcriptional regulator [Oscillospiraceae bacterium]
MLYKNLLNLRIDNDIRQKQIAEILNVSQNTYSQYENGIRALNTETLIKLSDFYNVSIDFLLDRTDNPKRL